MLENVTGVATGWAAWSDELSDQARDRYASSSARRRSDAVDNTFRFAHKVRTKLADLEQHSVITDQAVLDHKSQVIAAALARARARRAV